MDIMRCPGDRNPKINIIFYTSHCHFIYIQKIILYNISMCFDCDLYMKPGMDIFLLVTFYLHSNLWHTVVFMVQLIAQESLGQQSS